MPGLFDRIKDTTTFSGLLTVGTSFVVDNNPAPIYQTFRNRYSINDTNISVAITSQTSSNWMVCWCTYTNVDTLRVDEIIFTSNTSTPDAPVTFSGTSDVFVTASSRAVAGLREANTFTDSNYFTSASTGVIGIGNTSPLRKIDITGGGFAFTDSGGANGRAIHWGDRDTGLFPILLYGIATAADTHLSVRTNVFGGGFAPERLRVDSAGNVGIGTTSPTSRLHLVGSTINNSDFRVGSFNLQNYALNNTFLADNAYYDGTNMVRRETGGSAMVYLQSGEVSFRSSISDTAGTTVPNTATLKSHADGRFAVGPSMPGSPGVYTGANLFISAAGNVGINTVVPSERLSIATGASEFAVEWSGPGKAWVLGSAAGRAYIRNKTDSVEAISILNAGNVGIGTTSPEAKLHVFSDSLGSGAGNTQRISRLTTSIGGNTALFDIDARRHTAGSDWVGTNVRFSRTIDSTLTSFIDFGIDGQSASMGIGFGTSGTANRVVIDGVGRVGIGTASPSALLTIDDNAASGTGLVLTGGGSGQNLASFIRDVGSNAAVKINASSGNPQIVFESSFNTFTIGTSGNDFKISDDPVLGNNDRLTINSSGNVGIGTTSPSSLLHVKRGSNATEFYPAGTWAARVINATDSASENGLLVGNRWAATGSVVLDVGSIFGNGSGPWLSYYRVDGAGQSFWGNSGVERMRLDTNGSFGINTTPVANGSVVKLWVNGDISMPSTNRTILWNGYFNSSSGQWNYSSNGYLFALRENGGGKLEFFTSGNNTGGAGAVAGLSALMSLDATAAAPGNVGIGTASPLARLHVSGGDVRLDNNRALRFADTAGTGSVALLLQNDNNFVAYNPSGAPVFSFQTGANPVAAYGANTNNRMFLDASLNYMTFITNGSEQLRINNIGDVGIGTTGPESRLHSAGTVTIRQGNLAYLRLVVGAGQDNSGYIETRVGAGSTTLPAGSRVGFSGWYNGTQFYAAWTDVAVPMIFGTNGADRLKLEALGGVNVFGDFGVSGNYYVKGTNTIYGNPSGDTYGNFRVLQSVVQTDGMFINYNSAGTTTNAIRFYTPGITERMRITNTGSVAIGTSGGDYGRDWRLVVRQDHNADTQVGIINATSGTAANARLTHIVGTSNGFVERALYDGNGAPFFRNEYGAAINYEAWMFSGTSRMLLDNRGVLKLVNDQGPASGDTLALGFRGSPNNDRTASTYTFELTDAGKTVRKANTTVQTWTIPPESSVNFPVGTCIMVCNVQFSGNLTIARGSGVNLIFRSGTQNFDASRVIAQGGSATIRKVNGNVWTITGAGIS